MFSSQAAVEFMLIFAVLLFILSIIALVSFSKTIEISNMEREFEIKNILNKVAEKINTVYIEGDGFKANFTMPQDIFGSDYSINFNSNLILLNTSGLVYSKYIITQNVTGTLKKGTNMLENINGTIYIH